MPANMLLLNSRVINKHMAVKPVRATMIRNKVSVMSVHSSLQQHRSVSTSAPVLTYPLELSVTTLEISTGLLRLVLIYITNKLSVCRKKVFKYTITSSSAQRLLITQFTRPEM